MSAPSLEEILLEKMQQKISYNKSYNKYQHDYAYIDETLRNFLIGGKELSLDAICEEASIRFGEEITLSRITSAILNEEFNAINKWLMGSGVHLVVEDRMILLEAGAVAGAAPPSSAR